MTGINYGNTQYPQQYTMQYDANGRLGGMQVMVNGNGMPMMTASYGVAGEMLGLGYQGLTSGDTYSEARTYNAMLQLTRQTVTTGNFSSFGTGTAMDMQYVYTGGANNGRIAQSIDGVANETVNYTYDALNRLAGAGATSGTWGQAFTYDGFGNLVGKAVTAGSAPVLSVSVDPATNRVVGQTYDANGNAGAAWMYDVENRMIGGVNGEQYVYDQAGKRVKKRYGTSWEYYFYGVSGQKLVTQACTSAGCTAPQYNVYFGGKLVKSKGAVVLTDRLGSVRASALERMSYYPYGEEKTSTADGREKFGTYTRDNPATDYADQRYYAVGMGRFGTADPGGIKTADPSNPTSWNRYAYTDGDPVNSNDPEGLFECAVDGIIPCDAYALWLNLICPPGVVGCIIGVAGNDLADPPEPARAKGPKPIGFPGARAALLKPTCYQMFGFASAADAQAAFGSLNFTIGNYGQLQVQDGPDGTSVVQGTPPPSVTTNPDTNSVQINYSYGGWVDFSSILALDVTTGQQVMYNYLAAINNELGTNMTSANLTTLLLLHEFEHTAAGGNQPQENDFAAFNMPIYDNCIKQ